MSALKFSALWLLFAVTYFGFFGVIFRFFPELWLYHLFLEPGQDFIEEETWDSILLFTTMGLTLLVNLVFIFFSLVVEQQLRKSVINSFQYSGSVLVDALKFLSLWVLFAATYFSFFGLIYTFFPIEKWLSYLLREDYQNLFLKGTWNTLLVLTIMLSALVVNLVFIFLSLTITKRLRNRKNCTDERA